MLDSEIYQITQKLLSEKKLEKSKALGWYFNGYCSVHESSTFWSRVNIVHPNNIMNTREFFSCYPKYLIPTKLMRLLNEF